MAVARALLGENSAPIVYVYVGRLGNIVFATIMFASLLRLLPCFHSIAALIVMSPMFLFLTGSLSPDVSTTMYSLLATALFLHYAHARQSLLSPRDARVMACATLGAAIALGLCKSVYAPLTALYFLIPPRLVSSNVRYYALGALVVVVSFGCSLWWTGLVAPLYAPTLFSPGVFNGFPTASEGMAYIRHKPLTFVSEFVRDASRNLPFAIGSFVGYLGQLDVKLSDSVRALYGCLLLWVAITERSVQARLRDKLLSLSVVVAVIALIAVGQFVGWSVAQPDGSRVFPGESFQGRYFHPIGIVGLFVLQGAIVCLPARWHYRFADKVLSRLLVATAIAGMAVYALVLLVMRYYY
jgi:uncharacterized membrane protein